MRTIAPTPMYMTFPLVAVDVRSTDRPLPAGLRTARSWPVQTAGAPPPGRAWPGWRAGGGRSAVSGHREYLPAATPARLLTEAALLGGPAPGTCQRSNFCQPVTNQVSTSPVHAGRLRPLPDGPRLRAARGTSTIMDRAYAARSAAAVM